MHPITLSLIGPTALSQLQQRCVDKTVAQRPSFANIVALLERAGDAIY